MSDPNINHLNRVSEEMIIPNIIQFLELEGTTIAGATLRGGINFKHADGASGDSITFVATDSAGNDRTDIQLQFNANLEDLEDVTRTGAAAGHMLVYNDADDKYHSRPISGHVSVGTGGVVTIGVDVVGITNLNVATHGSSGHVLFNNDGGINFIEPVLSHLGDANISSVADTHLLIYNNSNSRFENKIMSGDATITSAGVISIGDDKIGTAELDGLTTGLDGFLIGPDGSGGLKYQTRVVNIADIAGPPAGQTAIMVHDGATASFQEGLNIPNLPVSLGGNCGGFVESYAVSPSIGIGSNNVLGVTGDGAGGKVWTFLNVTEIGTGATGLAGLSNISLNTIADGQLLIGDATGDGLFQNFAVSGDATLATNGVLTIGNAKVTNAKLANPGLTLATSSSSGLTYSAGGGTDGAGAGMTLGGDHSIKVNVDDSTIQIHGNTLKIKADGVDTNEIADSAVETNKINNDAVTTIKIPDDAVTNAKIANPTITVTADSGSQAIDLGDTLTVSGTDPIDTAQSGDTLTLSIDTATTSALGAAKFNTNNFVVNSGDVNIKVGGITAGSIAADAVVAAGIADGAVGLSAFNIKSGEHGASGHVMIRFGEGTNQEVGFVPQSSVTASLKLGDLTDVNTGATGAHHVIKVKDGGGGFTTAQLDHSHMADISANTVLGNNSGSSSAPLELTANQLIGLVNTADGSVDFDSDVLPTTLVNTNTTNTFTAIQTFQRNSGPAIKVESANIDIKAPNQTEWARGLYFSKNSSYGDGSGVAHKGAIGMYANGGGDDLDYMFINAEESTAPHSGSSLKIGPSGHVGINIGGTDAPPTSVRFSVYGKSLITDSVFMATQGGVGKNRVVIGSTSTIGLEADADDTNLLHIAPGDNHSHLYLDHRATNGFGAIFFGPYSEGLTDADTEQGRIIIQGRADGADSKFSFRNSGYTRFADQNEDTIHMSIQSGGQIAMGPGHDGVTGGAASLLHLDAHLTTGLGGEHTWAVADDVFSGAFGNDTDGTKPGTIHIDTSNLAYSGGAITFGLGAGRPFAGIYSSHAGSFGTMLGFATTNSFAAGPRMAGWIDSHRTWIIGNEDSRVPTGGGGVFLHQSNGSGSLVVRNHVHIGQTLSLSDANSGQGSLGRNLQITCGSETAQAIYFDVPTANDDDPDQHAGSRICTNQGNGNFQILAGCDFDMKPINQDGHSEIEMSEDGAIRIGAHKGAIGTAVINAAGSETGLAIVPNTTDSSSYVRISAGKGEGYLDLAGISVVKNYGEGILPFVFHKELQMTSANADDDTQGLYSVDLSYKNRTLHSLGVDAIAFEWVGVQMVENTTITGQDANHAIQFGYDDIVDSTKGLFRSTANDYEYYRDPHYRTSGGFQAYARRFVPTNYAYLTLGNLHDEQGDYRYPATGWMNIYNMQADGVQFGSSNAGTGTVGNAGRTPGLVHYHGNMYADDTVADRQAAVPGAYDKQEFHGLFILAGSASNDYMNKRLRYWHYTFADAGRNFGQGKLIGRVLY